MIPVTKSLLPPKEEFIKYLDKIWASNQLTNNGLLVQELEAKLKEFLDVKHLFFVSNGTIALQIAIKALVLQGEVITTPFSYVATTSSLVWEGCHPVFVDIDPQNLCLNPNLIEDAITEKTTGILATHVYGIPCDVDKIKLIADKYRLKVLYDAAHTFGGMYHGKSIASFGDISTLSFHATKIFHTVEGGAVITNNDELAHRISYMRNFGHKGQEDFWGLGINGKNSEFHAAMGLCILPNVIEIISQRRQLSIWYDDSLNECNLTKPSLPLETEYNFAYYPVIFENEEKLQLAKKKLNEQNIYPRRYFFPTLNALPYINSQICEIADEVTTKVMCLPLFPGLSKKQVTKIMELIKSTQ